MVRAEVSGQKIARAEAWLGEVEDLVSVSPEAFAADARRADLASFYLFLAIQEAIDLAAHWLADAGLPPADDVGSTFDVLASRGAIPPELAAGMRAIVRVRNRIAHGYTTVDHQRVHAEAPEGVATRRRFLGSVASASASTP
ncbi:MAG: DUF86 domain-containing protein [Myxococcales bacterium]|nr:DUF86 domain-containing protein [Myxococcales bacterium]